MLITLQRFSLQKYEMTLEFTKKKSQTEQTVKSLDFWSKKSLNEISFEYEWRVYKLYENVA